MGIGLDLVDLDRFRLLYGDDLELMGRCFAQSELDAAGTGPDRLTRLAARFAAKEAAYKALGGASGIAHTDIIVSNSSSGAPTLLLKGTAREAADSKGVGMLLLSLTHSDASAAAVVVALSAGPK
ncbi:4'-phosphopantetheinyl transferase superfamily protein [Aminobacter anthyllidis]|uniref:Holo-[acyl-carrier-protein] synthase n=1 Tax=Aminobacter anthyllidis TaxID=1035067 RepID=A0A9X1AHB9_9HYPH|nr:4'-phosphopantetheinyl transferase superfamily protein [Aminobacter anthyllidis]